jgi:DNA polymerase-3 subunit alpha
MDYVSLHHHSTFSYGDGYGLPKEHVERCATLGMTAMALTEHGNTSSHPSLEKACAEFGIKGIYGVEGYIAGPKERRKCHQTILAMDQVGYANLNRMVSQSWRDFYRWPTIHLDTLETYSDGLIVLSGCADSTLACTLLGGKSFGDKRESYTDQHYESAIRLVEWYQAIFGDRYYLECQRFPGLGRTCALNPAYERLSRDTGVALVATSDCHYVFARDNEMQKILHAAHRSASVSQVEASWEYDITLDIPTSDDRVESDLRATGLSDSAAYAALINTKLIANRCNVTLPKVEPIRYKYDESDLVPWV